MCMAQEEVVLLLRRQSKGFARNAAKLRGMNAGVQVLLRHAHADLLQAYISGSTQLSMILMMMQCADMQ